MPAAPNRSLPVSLLVALLAVTLTACGGDDTGGAKQAKPWTAASKNDPYAGLPAEVVERLRTEPDTSGQPIVGGAFDYSVESLDLDLKDVVRKLEVAYESKDAKAFAAALEDDVRGSVPDGILTGSDGRDATHDGPSKKFVEGPEAVTAAMESFFGEFSQIYDGFFKCKAYLGEVTTRRVHARVKQDLRGIRKDRSVHHEHVVWRMAFRRADEESEWKIDRIFVTEREQRNAPKALFREVTTSAGLFVTEPPQCGITGLGNVHRTENLTQYDYGGVCVYDVDQDGRLDIFMPNAYGPFGLYMNQGDGTFTNEAEERGLVSIGGTRGAVFGDLDNDGDPDLFIARAPFHHPSVARNANSLYENLGGGKFREITTPAGLKQQGAFMSPTMLDYDRDGDLDLFVTSYGIGEAYRTGQHHPYNATHGLRNYLYRNDGELRFTDVTAEAGLADHTYWSYAVAVVDWNKDLYPDLYVANDFGPNNFYVNRGDGTFEDRAEALGVVDVGNGMGATFVDYDNDSRWDLYVTNMQSSTGQRVLRTASDLVSDEDMQLLWKLTLGNSMFRGNDNESFDDSNAQKLGIANCQWAWNGDFADFDADGDSDLIVLNGYYSGVEAKDC